MTNERLTDKRALVRIVDDDEDLLQALAFMVKSEGWEVKKQVSEDRKFAPPEANLSTIPYHNLPKLLLKGTYITKLHKASNTT